MDFIYLRFLSQKTLAELHPSFQKGGGVGMTPTKVY